MGRLFGLEAGLIAARAVVRAPFALEQPRIGPVDRAASLTTAQPVTAGDAILVEDNGSDSMHTPEFM